MPQHSHPRRDARSMTCLEEGLSHVVGRTLGCQAYRRFQNDSDPPLVPRSGSSGLRKSSRSKTSKLRVIAALPIPQNRFVD